MREYLNERQLQAVETDKDKVVVMSVPASGKAQPNDTLIPTPSGYKKIGELRPGDEVFSRDGLSERILEVFPQGKQRVYEVEFEDGRVVECCGEHLWSYDGGQGILTTKTLKEMYENGWYCFEGGQRIFNYRIPLLKNPVWYLEQEYNVEPYLMGTFIATEEFGNERIPEKYLIGNYEQRKQLLRGLIDINGEVDDKEKVSKYYTNNLQIAKDVLELSRSMGFWSEIQENNEFQYPSKYTVKIFSENKREFINIIDIRKTEIYKDMTCILVEHPEHLYLTNNFIVTHNTTVLTERVKYLIEQGADPKKTVVITFTRAAAAEMKKRIGKTGKEMFIGTIHAYANSLLTNYNVDTSGLLADERFDELFKLVAENPGCIQPVDYLLVDETQDCDADQFTFLLNYIKPKSFFLVGDIRQTIYEWRNSRPDILFEIMGDPEVTVYQLQYNYRNAIRITNYASNIIEMLGTKYKDNTIPARKDNGIVLKMRYSVSKIADKIFYSEGDFKDWFILTRTNEELSKIYEGLTSLGIPCESFKKSDLDNETLRERLNNNTVKVLTVHAAKGLEAKNVVVVGVRLEPKNPESYRIAYVAATRAKDQLIWCTSGAAKPKARTNIKNWE